ncbi:MAG: hypothetical protein HRT90_11665 [Candidatus Margulisbacteria bacterium]|nr:hypothetical protein [Candidatus Margulisiibacteriota bacterium]
MTTIGGSSPNERKSIDKPVKSDAQRNLKPAATEEAITAADRLKSIKDDPAVNDKEKIDKDSEIQQELKSEDILEDAAKKISRLINPSGLKGKIAKLLLPYFNKPLMEILDKITTFQTDPSDRNLFKVIAKIDQLPGQIHQSKVLAFLDDTFNIHDIRSICEKAWEDTSGDRGQKRYFTDPHTIFGTEEEKRTDSQAAELAKLGYVDPSTDVDKLDTDNYKSALDRFKGNLLAVRESKTLTPKQKQHYWAYGSYVFSELQPFLSDDDKKNHVPYIMAMLLVLDGKTPNFEDHKNILELSSDKENKYKYLVRKCEMLLQDSDSIDISAEIYSEVIRPGFSPEDFVDKFTEEEALRETLGNFLEEQPLFKDIVTSKLKECFPEDFKDDVPPTEVYFSIIEQKNTDGISFEDLVSMEERLDKVGMFLSTIEQISTVYIGAEKELQSLCRLKRRIDTYYEAKNDKLALEEALIASEKNSIKEKVPMNTKKLATLSQQAKDIKEKLKLYSLVGGSVLNCFSYLTTRLILGVMNEKHSNADEKKSDDAPESYIDKYIADIKKLEPDNPALDIFCGFMKKAMIAEKLISEN